MTVQGNVVSFISLLLSDWLVRSEFLICSVIFSAGLTSYYVNISISMAALRSKAVEKEGLVNPFVNMIPDCHRSFLFIAFWARAHFPILGISLEQQLLAAQDRVSISGFWEILILLTDHQKEVLNSLGNRLRSSPLTPIWKALKERHLHLLSTDGGGTD